MSYQVLGGPTKGSEFELYLEALRECGLKTERNANGRLGVVESQQEAKRVLDAVRRRIRWLSWQVVKLPDEGVAG
jgi:hypothetical protein